MNRQYMIAGIIAAVVLLLVGAGIVLYGLSQGASLPIPVSGLTETTPAPEATPGLADPQIEVTPPPSLEEIADQIRPDYPELAELLENPELSSVYKDFYLAYQEGGAETAIALAHQRGILNEQDQVVMTLVLDTEESAGLISQLEAEGIIVQASLGNMINIAIPLSLIQEQIEAENPDLIVDRISELEHVIRLELPFKATPKQGEILGQGVSKTFAANWHEQGVTGEGVKIGVLDLGFAGYEDLLGQELPEQVTVEAFGDTSLFDEEVHGTACAEIIHEMAPGAELYLAYYDGTDLAMGLAMNWLAEQGVDIISNSTGSNGLTPLDGSGFIPELVDELHEQGIFWVNAAGNEATSHYRGQFSDSDNDTLHEFSEDSQTLPFIPYTTDEEVTIILSWDDWAQADQDYELILMDEEGEVLAKSEDSQNGEEGAVPVEGFLYTFDDQEVYLLSIENYENNARGDATFDLFIHGGEIHPNYIVPGYSLSSPSEARGAFAVGAVHWADDVLEPYSSQGPTADGRIKPDLSAPSVVDSASYAPDAFDGTSAAAPHVAGAAALVKQAFPEFSPDQLATFLQERAIDLGNPGADNAFGVGRLNMGANPETPTEPEATPVIIAEVQPTSTPRIAPVIDGGVSPEEDFGEATGDEDAAATALGFIMLAGLCILCLGGLLLPVIVVMAIFFRR